MVVIGWPFLARKRRLVSFLLKKREEFWFFGGLVSRKGRREKATRKERKEPSVSVSVLKGAVYKGGPLEVRKRGEQRKISGRQKWVSVCMKKGSAKC